MTGFFKTCIVYFESILKVSNLSSSERSKEISLLPSPLKCVSRRALLDIATLQPL